MPTPSSFGDWLKQRRKALRLTQDDLARQVGCSTISIRKIEADERHPSLEIAEALAEQLEIPSNERSLFLRFARGETGLDELRQRSELSADESQPRIVSLQRNPSLPIPLTPLIGRAQELRTLRPALIQGEARLMSLIGPGGIGKTRLALALAHEVAPTFTDGVVFVALDMVADAAAVPLAIVRALGLSDADRTDARARLYDYLHDRHLLLVLDNFEHVLSAAPVVSEILSGCPWLQVLVTSRSPLRLRGERQVKLAPLTVPAAAPDSLDELMAQSSAVALFNARAQDAQPDWSAEPHELPTLIELCRRLDGLPLAIELAAAQCAVLTLQETLDQLNAHAVLDEIYRDLPPRQQTLHNAIDWSYDLLDPPTQQLFVQLAVFRGNCTAAALTAVCGDQDGTATSALMQRVHALVDQSLLRREVDADGVARYSFLNTIQKYAQARLDQSDALGRLRLRHLSYYLQLAETIEPWPPRDQLRWSGAIERDYSNFQAALEYAQQVEDGIGYGLRLAGVLGEFWFVRSYLAEGRRWLELLLERDQRRAGPERARALFYAGLLASAQGDYTRARMWDSECLALSQTLGDAWGTAHALAALGDVLVWHDQDTGRGYAMLEEALQRARALNDPWLIGRVAWRAGIYSYYAGRDVHKAAEQLEESLLHARAAGDLWGISNVLPHLGNLRLTQGEHALAATITEDALVHARSIGNQRGMAVSLNVLGLIALAQGDLDRAQSYHQEGLQVAQDAGLSFQQAAALRFLGRLATSAARLDLAQTRLLAGLKLYRRMQDRLGVALCLIDLADVVQHQSSYSIAVEVLSAAHAIIAAIGAGLVEPEQSQYQRILAATERSLNPAEWQRAWSAGQHVALDALVARLERPFVSAKSVSMPVAGS